MTMIYEPFEALVLSAKAYNDENKETTLLMITSANYSQWKGDVHLTHWQEAGLKKPCFARMKFFSIDNGIIISRIGRLSGKDQLSVTRAIVEHFNLP